MHPLKIFLPLCALVAATNTLQAQQIRPARYHLFNPVPRNQMREMETDRPDITETPYTVDAGHFQYEADVVRDEMKHDAASSTEDWFFNQATLKAGVTKSMEVQLQVQSYEIHRETEINSGKQVSRGFGNLTLRVKQNIRGNNAGNFIIAALPYLKFPTSKLVENNQVEGGIIIPMLVKLPGEWKLGLQVEADRLMDEKEKGMHTEVLQSVAISHKIIGKLDGIAETYYRYDFKHHHLTNYVNAALQLEVLKDFLLDAGVYYGIQSEAEKNYFVGTSFRF